MLFAPTMTGIRSAYGVPMGRRVSVVPSLMVVSAGVSLGNRAIK
jgi:hypothetical protein